MHPCVSVCIHLSIQVAVMVVIHRFRLRRGCLWCEILAYEMLINIIWITRTRYVFQKYENIQLELLNYYWKERGSEGFFLFLAPLQKQNYFFHIMASTKHCQTPDNSHFIQRNHLWVLINTHICLS